MVKITQHWKYNIIINFIVTIIEIEEGDFSPLPSPTTSLSNNLSICSTPRSPDYIDSESETPRPNASDWNNTQNNNIYKSEWWADGDMRDTILEIGKDKLPHYIYNLPVVESEISNLKKSLVNVDELYYSVKANAHPRIIKLLDKLNVHFQCNTFEQVQYILSLLPSSKILFTPFMNQIEVIKNVILLNKNIEIAIDSIDILLEIQKLQQQQQEEEEEEKEKENNKFNNLQFAIRINCIDDPVYAGIPLSKINELFELIEKMNITIIGLHTHIPSKLYNNDTYSNISKIFMDIIKSHKDNLKLKWVDLGGGLSVYTGWDSTKRSSILDIQRIETAITLFKSQLISYFPKCQIRIEPGKYIVSKCGIFVSSIVSIQQKGQKRYIALNTGINNFINTMHLNEYHTAHNLSKWSSTSIESRESNDNTKFQMYQVIANNEDNRILASDRLFPIDTSVNDIIILEHSGAYCSVFKSRYCMSTASDEICLNDYGEILS